MTRRWLTVVVVASGWFCPGGAIADEHAEPRECSMWSGDFSPCTLTPRPEGGYTVRQQGPENFSGTLVPQGDGFHLEGTVRLPNRRTTQLVGDVALKDAVFQGPVRGGKKRDLQARMMIRPRIAAAELETAMAKLVDRESVAAGARFPLPIKVIDAPKFSFTVKTLDDAGWKKLHGIFGMVQVGHNIGIECTTRHLECVLTAHSSAQVSFFFTTTPKGLKLIRVELPAEGD